MNNLIYFDFEYNDTMVLMCATLKNGVGDIFDLRNGKELEALRQYIESNLDNIFVSYALSAEIDSLLRLGISVDRMKCADLMAEARMITMSHDSYFTADSSMLGQRRALLKEDVKEDKEHKEKMRELILSKNEWNGEEWDEISLYCWSDIEPLPAMFEKIVSIHEAKDHPFRIEDVLSRGEYVRMCAEMDFVSPGFPVYGGAVTNIYGNKPKVRTSIIQNLPIHWKMCYEKKGKVDGWTLKRNSVKELCKVRGWDGWKKTETGMPVLEADYLKELSLRIPEVKDLYTAVRALSTLNSADLRDQLKDGYIGTKTFSFAAKTGRNGLKPKQGFLLNLPRWMRRMVQPHPDMALVGFDWSQQEIAIAAALSGDQKLIAAYASGDIYLALGKMAGQIPEDGTKKTHGLERDLFKALQLGLGYGKGVTSLGVDFYGIMKASGVSEIDAKIKAKEIYAWHKAYFSTYWDWVNKQVNNARIRGWIETSDGWVEWVSRRTLTTQLLNFPSQATGASMLRKAVKLCYKEWKAGNIPPMLCSQHDAVYFNDKDNNSENTVKIVTEIMRVASKDEIGIEVRCDPKVYTVAHPYLPDNWEERHETLWTLATQEKT